MTLRRRDVLRLGVAAGLAPLGLPARAQPPAPRNLIVVTTDGLRWQEVFRGRPHTPIAACSRRRAGSSEREAESWDVWLSDEKGR